VSLRLNRVLAFALAFLLVSAQAPAQSSRVEAVAVQQATKAERLGPERPGRGEQVVVRVLSSPLLAATGGVYPWFGSVFPGAGFSGGVGYLARYPSRTQLSLVGAVSLTGSTLLDAGFTGPTLAGGTLTPRLSASLTRVKGLSYFGTGPDSPREATTFDYTPLTFGAGLTLSPVGWLRIDGEYQALHVETGGGTAPALPLVQAPGFARELRYHVPRVSVAADWRPAPGYATRGGLLRASLAHYAERRQQPFEFRAVELETVQLVPLVREQFVLAFRGLATFTDADAGHAVPFVLLPTVGSGRTVRGYANRRFADRHRLVLTGEYRWRPSRYLDLAIFMDAGQVAPDRSDLALSRLKTAWGAGARLHGPAFTALRFDVARSREGLTFVVAAGPPF
jgi:hypothetical protein